MKKLSISSTNKIKKFLILPLIIQIIKLLTCSSSTKNKSTIAYAFIIKASKNNNNHKNKLSFLSNTITTTYKSTTSTTITTLLSSSLCYESWIDDDVIDNNNPNYNKIIIKEIYNKTLTIPKHWIASKLNNNKNNEVQNGPYTVIRCSYNNNKWNVNGKTFHFKRLLSSFYILYPNYNKTNILELKQNETDFIMNNLVQQYNNNDNDMILMITMLWKISTTTTNNNINIKIYMQSKIINNIKPYPISLSIAIPPSSSLSILPNRYGDNKSKAKLYNWISDRAQKLENIYTFKPNYINEVILTKNNNILLEGLTSNLFIVYYKNNEITIQTSKHNVLYGYIRHCIINIITQNNKNVILKVKDIYLNDLLRCNEIFITNSISLIKPVDKVYIPSYNNNKEYYDGNNNTLPLKLFWSSPSSFTSYDDKINNINNKTTLLYDNNKIMIPIWKQLYDLLLNYYEEKFYNFFF